MGDEIKNCVEWVGLERDGNICSQEELESIYLDRYNRQLIGLEQIKILIKNICVLSNLDLQQLAKLIKLCCENL